MKAISSTSHLVFRYQCGTYLIKFKVCQIIFGLVDKSYGVALIDEGIEIFGGHLSNYLFTCIDTSANIASIQPTASMLISVAVNITLTTGQQGMLVVSIDRSNDHRFHKRENA